ncbi:UNVERIFIED_CONTAM: putative 1-acyl-sn-glycerol-3-phosphate acyltransferase 4 [Sesamum calycinum]|uniref:1-acyl-sn-glycerol-3-phosphate acyltransferase 4 n=1 Tax=Sesamum calycinum TaxID=2727403 RepID=A0AAW2PAX0_9LAMI
MYLWNLARRNIKCVLMSSLMKLAVFGWGLHLLEFIPVNRKWEFDESTMRSTFADPQDPLQLAVVPEGTDHNEEKCTKNQKVAAVTDARAAPKDKGIPCLL